VKRYLINKGIAAERISTESKGVDTQAADDNKARRAEIRLLIIEN
jgi:outer membrane protein OmpA-like peptidoglycan-associated protein